MITGINEAKALKKHISCESLLMKEKKKKKKREGLKDQNQRFS